MEWQPIETAPSNGDRILVTGGRYAGDVELVGADGNWWRHNLRENPQSQSVPTHWMPLPEPPAERR